jgi:hypothetical protein
MHGYDRPQASYSTPCGRRASGVETYGLGAAGRRDSWSCPVLTPGCTPRRWVRARLVVMCTTYQCVRAASSLAWLLPTSVATARLSRRSGTRAGSCTSTSKALEQRALMRELNRAVHTELSEVQRSVESFGQALTSALRRFRGTVTPSDDESVIVLQRCAPHWRLAAR